MVVTSSYELDGRALMEGSRDEIIRRAAYTLSGRLAEIYAGGTLNTSWDNDMRQARSMIINFVKAYSPSGSINFKDKQPPANSTPEGQFNPPSLELNAKEMKEAEAIFEEAKRMANEVLSKHEKLLFKLKDLLLKRGFLPGDEFRKLFNQVGIDSHVGQVNKITERIIAVAWADSDALSERFIENELMPLDVAQLNNPEVLQSIERLFKPEHSRTIKLAKKWIEQTKESPISKALERLLSRSDCGDLLK